MRRTPADRRERRSRFGAVGRSGRRLSASALTLAALALTVSAVGDAVVGSAPAAGAGTGAAVSPWMPGDGALPANADEDPLVTLTSLACPVAGSCVAVGDYTDSSGNQQGLIETLAAGDWSASEAPLPTTMASDPLVSLGAVTCPQNGACVATGDFTDADGDQRGLIETLTTGTWAAITAPLPAGAGGNPVASLDAPACPSDGSCVVTGDYTDSDGIIRGTIDTLAAGAWTALPVPLPAGAGANPGSTIGAADCPALGSCVAMAEYNDTAGNAQSAVETLSGGTWTALEAPPPADEAASGHQRNLLGPVTCAQVGACVAVGSFTPASGNFQGLIETLSGGTWTATDAPLPADAPTDVFASLGTVTCATADACVAFGWYYDTSANYHVVSETLAEGTWTATAQATPTHPSARNPADPADGLGEVTCPAAASCVAVGSYFDKAHRNRSTIETLAGGTWTTIKAPVPTKAAGNQASGLDGVVCSSDGSCVAVGSLGGDPLIETMAGGDAAPAVSSADEADFTLGQPGTFTVTATGTPLPAIKRKGGLPKGLHFTAGTGSATISGTPTGAPGNFPVTIEAQNGVLPSATQFLTVTVAP